MKKFASFGKIEFIFLFFFCFSRLFVIYDKAKEYIQKILSSIDQQMDLWQYRRQIIADQSISSSSFDFLLPKVQRINELTIEAAQGKVHLSSSHVSSPRYIQHCFQPREIGLD